MVLSRFINRNQTFRKNPLGSRKLKKFMAAAALIPGLVLGANPAAAQTPVDGASVSLGYSYYKDYQSGEDNGRMRIFTPTMFVKAPFLGKNEVEGSFVLDSMTGASPQYLSTLSGASGLAIHDRRKAGDIKVTHYFDQFSLGVGSRVSTENDYFSRGGLIESKIWTPDKNTTFSLGFSADWDKVSSTNDENIHNLKRTQGYFAGVTQVLDQNSIIQSNLGYTSSDGYLTDPYKFLDNRPASREGWAWLTRYNYYLASLDAALHTDFRLYRDTWGITSETLEFAWYQPLGEHWMVRPNVRYYSQGAADFFSSIFPPENFDSLYSADQRMSAFGGITTGIKVTRELGQGFSVDGAFSFLQQRPGFTVFESGSSNIKPFYAYWLTVGLTKKF